MIIRAQGITALMLVAACGGSTPPKEDLQAQLNVAQQTTGSVVLTVAQALFFRDGLPKPADPNRCQTEFVQGCDIVSCTNDGGTSGVIGGTPVKAGTVVATIGSDTWQIAPIGNALYVFTGVDKPAWADGTPLGMSATGDSMNVPALSGMLEAPAKVKVTSWAADAGTVTRGMPFEVRFMPVPSGTARVSFSSVSDGAARVVNTTCRAPSTSGTITVPGAVTQKLELGASVSVDVGNDLSSTTNQSGWNVVFDVGTSESWPIRVQ